MCAWMCARVRAPTFGSSDPEADPDLVGPCLENLERAPL